MNILNEHPEDILYEICKSFIIVADEALLSKEIDINTYNELTKLKYSFIKYHEIELGKIEEKLINTH